MIDHYNAFISYKHAPEDNKVAEAVHRGLERFHIPGKIRKKTGIKRISRIFRDKDELPITSDLSDTIAHALAESDYLIVICSTNTKQSAWVPLEIEYFLKNHTKRQIFTVLVNGEPYDVIPEILLYEDRVVKDENGNEQTVRIPIEPLSCDYRIPPAKAKRTELPRLASGIIGCAYDELMNRRRAYKMKQLTAVFSIALALLLGFSGYMYYSRDQIRKNYLESLKNQSRYLANESGNLLEKEQRITALQLALEALPKDDEDERPVTAEAVKALTDATLAYEGNNGTNIHAAWNYQMGGIVTDFHVNEAGTLIAIFDEGNVVGVWDTNTHENKLYVDDLKEQVDGIRFADDAKLLVWTDHSLYAYDTGKGEQLFAYTDKKTIFEDRYHLMMTDREVYLSTYDNAYHKIDLATGKLLDTITLPQQEGFEDFSIVESRISPDGKKIAFRGIGGLNSYSYGILDLASKQAVIAPYLEEMVGNIEWAGEDKLMVASTVIDSKGSMAFGSREILSSDHSTIRCVETGDLSEKWNTDFVCNGVMLQSGFKQLGKDSVAYYSGNVISVYDLGTGEEQYKSNVNDSVIDISDRDGDGSPAYVTSNGGYATPALNIDADAVYYNKYFADNLRQAVVNNGVYVRAHLAHEVIYYGVHVYDEDWTALDETQLADLPDEYAMDETCLAILSKEAETGAALHLYGLGEKGGHKASTFTEGDPYDYQILGMADGRAYVGYGSDQGYTLLSTDQTGEVRKDEMEIPSSTFGDFSILKGGKLIYVSRNEDYENALAVYDLASMENSPVVLPEECGPATKVLAYYEEENLLCLQGGEDFLLDLKSGKDIKLTVPEDWEGGKVYSDVSAGGLFAVSDEKQILLCDGKGKVSVTIDCPGISPIGMTFIDDAFVALYNDGSLYFYEKSSGAFKKKVEVTGYYNFSGKTGFDLDRETGLLYISMGRLTDVIDIESGIETAHVESCFGHLRGRDLFITSARASGEDYKVGYFKRYSVKELMEKAKRILQNAELSDVTKSRYGI